MSTLISCDQDLDLDLIGSISSLLSTAGVPNLLWGECLLTVYGVPTIVDGVSFVVPDALLETGLSTLSHAGLASCTQDAQCPFVNSVIPYLATAQHLHLSDDLVLSLHRKSDTLWELPDFEIDANNEDIMSAADTRLPPAILGRGEGRFPPRLSGVRIPSAVRYCEAIILLLCRDHESLREHYWMAILTYLLEYVDETEIFQENWLREDYRPFYGAMKQGDRKMFLHLRTLREGLIQSSA
ncbi:hypothetical protein BDW42DRAFT_80989 [Aspergillus taichungensis]|uniref:Uncharacterized protein n=1 Tax=Aspergillus taichungensis TaxID=482145 RepID=A0A2J5HYB2_9EURO|nr:hypothetical protein BDW42DRAFT_80989 [Aspergillus taichungensis]